MPLSLLDQQRKQLEQLMKKSSNLVPIAGLQDEAQVNDTEIPIADDSTDKKDKYSYNLIVWCQHLDLDVLTI
ncbi:DEHA2D15620p [Debaryomyces hansenii CBS767]|uniref:DEHA2D15620p n=1 Tax=Debaryomyces hansenii (strain ATCC 36239 / CBS 767 / BCRC 21394 / JCM 1990 / NBRC 0083 / IGC 2968) TaxID=284592 RepID=B5RTJ0_DEBHA|nr:DEHA2D15620p [Debaryomyces hansenii CBS767]CAR65675.1 DEHA2D15620p [Debaryomyces hansenii CBS767]|eukprot:XP_002770321.1 DEHA2D15620p [Debaryomyces hansenii CBS767]